MYFSDFGNYEGLDQVPLQRRDRLTLPSPPRATIGPSGQQLRLEPQFLPTTPSTTTASGQQPAHWRPTLSPHGQQLQMRQRPTTLPRPTLPSETPAEAGRRIFPEAPRAPRSFERTFWPLVDQGLTSLMLRLRVPNSVRGPLRIGIHQAIRMGSTKLLDDAIRATRLPRQTQSAIRNSTVLLLDAPRSR